MHPVCASAKHSDRTQHNYLLCERLSTVSPLWQLSFLQKYLVSSALCEVFIILECDASSLSNWFPVFWEYALISKHWKQITQWHDVTSRKNTQLNYTAAKAPDLHHYMQTVVTIKQKNKSFSRLSKSDFHHAFITTMKIRTNASPLFSKNHCRCYVGINIIT